MLCRQSQSFSRSGAISLAHGTRPRKLATAIHVPRHNSQSPPASQEGARVRQAEAASRPHSTHGENFPKADAASKALVTGELGHETERNTGGWHRTLARTGLRQSLASKAHLTHGPSSQHPARCFWRRRLPSSTLSGHRAEATQQPQLTVAQGPGEGWRRPKHSPAPGEVAHKGL